MDQKERAAADREWRHSDLQRLYVAPSHERVVYRYRVVVLSEVWIVQVDFFSLNGETEN